MNEWMNEWMASLVLILLVNPQCIVDLVRHCVNSLISVYNCSPLCIQKRVWVYFLKSIFRLRICVGYFEIVVCLFLLCEIANDKQNIRLTACSTMYRNMHCTAVGKCDILLVISNFRDVAYYILTALLFHLEFMDDPSKQSVVFLPSESEHSIGRLLFVWLFSKMIRVHLTNVTDRRTDDLL